MQNGFDSKRDQQEGETVALYVVHIRKLSEYCEFGDNLGDPRRDRLVRDLRNEQTQKQLLSERNLMIDRAVDISVAVETATKDAAELGQHRDGTAIHKANLCRTGDSTENHASDVHGMDILLLNAGSEMHSVKNVNRKTTSS